MSFYHMQEENNFPKAFGIAGGIMGVLLLVSFFIMIGKSIPEFGMGGVIVNYGMTEVGMGTDYMRVDEPSMDPNANEVIPDKIDREQSPDETPSQQVADRSVVTQDVEDAPAIVSNKETKVDAPVSTVKKEDAKPAVNPNALYKGRQNSSSGRGDGTGDVAGNQGSDLGDPLSSDYGEGGSGDGNARISVTNRSWVVPPAIEDNGQQSGIVAVEIHVAPNGTITYARAGVRGTTLPDKNLWEKCEAALRGARYNQLEKAPTVQKATIYIRFGLK